ncbi:MAG: ATP-binding cassette domain-containing protein [Lachnospiraceae bacterium]|nr:ATP-binding cassette domain-containing protein [Lachnospiraceae bacterium]
MENVVLKTNRLTKVYKNTEVNKRVSVTINKGEIYGLVGADGAGKTTLLKMITGLAKPTKGSITLLGAKEDDELSAVKKKIGFVVEGPALYPSMTAHENCLVKARYLGYENEPDYEQKVNDILSLVGLKDVEGKKINDYSMDMKQRMALALALIGEPEFIMLDELFYGVDEKGVKELREVLLKINKDKGITILFATNKFRDVEGVATTYGFMHRGRIVREASAEKIARELEDNDNNVESYITNMIQRYAEGVR